MSDKPQDWHGEALDSKGTPLGAPMDEAGPLVDHLTITSIAHNVHYAVPEPDPLCAARQALRLADAVADGAPVTARESLRLWVELYHDGDADLTARARAALDELAGGDEGQGEGE